MKPFTGFNLTKLHGINYSFRTLYHVSPVLCCSSSQAQEQIQAENMSPITELLLVGLGHQKSRPYLLVGTDAIQYNLLIRNFLGP